MSLPAGHFVICMTVQSLNQFMPDFLSGHVLVSLSFRFGSPKPEQFILESTWMLVSSLKMFPQGVRVILCSLDWSGWVVLHPEGIIRVEN